MQINLLDFQERLKLKTANSETLIWDPLRKKYIVFTPEEMVRQLCLEYLVEEGKYPRAKFNAEKGLFIGGRNYRYDLLLFDNKFKPFLLVECKAPSVKLNNLTFEQISGYNRELKVPFLLITNGPNMYLAEINWNNSSFNFVDKLPEYPVF